MSCSCSGRLLSASLCHPLLTCWSLDSSVISCNITTLTRNIRGWLQFFVVKACDQTILRMNHIIDSLILYTLENGSLTWQVFSPKLILLSTEKPKALVQSAPWFACVIVDIIQWRSYSYSRSCLQWLAMPKNLIFLGMHFVICKREPVVYFNFCVVPTIYLSVVYANSLLATSVPWHYRDISYAT